MTVPPARSHSYEDLLHHMTPGGLVDKLIALWRAPSTRELLERRGHRAIGVVYRPEYEAFGNYVPSVLPRRYDALLFIDQTRALGPLHAKPEPSPAHEMPETYPFGV